MKGESVFALLAGAAIGAALGVLFAPDKGEETRRKLKKVAEDGYATAKNKAGEVYDKVKDGTSEARKDFESLRQLLAEAGGGMKEEARKKILEQLEKLEKALSANVDDVDEQRNAEV